MRNRFWLWVASFLARRQNLVASIVDHAKRTPYWHLRGYMNRWWVWPFDRYRRLFGFKVRIHEILTPDADAHFHNHPWAFRTVVLRGGYVETYLDGGIVRSRLLGPGSTALMGPDHYHRITSVSSGTTTMVFLYRKTGRSWGFLVDGQHIPFHKYESVKASVVDDPSYREYVASNNR